MQKNLPDGDIGTDQRIVSLDMRQWSEFVRIFGMEEAMVKRKSNDDGDDEDIDVDGESDE